MSGSKTRPPTPEDPYAPTPTGKQILFVVPEPGAVSMEYLWNTVKRHKGVILERGGERMELTVVVPNNVTNTEKQNAAGEDRKPTALCELPLLESNQDSPDPEAGNKGKLEG